MNPRVLIVDLLSEHGFKLTAPLSGSAIHFRETETCSQVSTRHPCFIHFQLITLLLNHFHIENVKLHVICARSPEFLLADRSHGN